MPEPFWVEQERARAALGGVEMECRICRSTVTRRGRIRYAVCADPDCRRIAAQSRPAELIRISTGLIMLEYEQILRMHQNIVTNVFGLGRRHLD